LTYRTCQEIPCFYGTRSFITWSQNPATWSYPEPAKSN